jgi:hypothetical protein
MWFIFDNLRAMMIAGAVLLMLLTAMTRSREMGVEQLSVYSAKSHSLDLAEWLEDDISSLGSNFDSTTVRFLLPEMEDGNTVNFTFHRDTIGAAPDFVKIRIETRYQLLEADQAELRDTTMQMYQLVRDVRVQQGAGWSAWVEDGRSSPRLSYFMVSLLDDFGQSVATESETTFLKMDFSIIPPFPQGRQFLNQLSWGTTIRLRPY